MIFFDLAKPLICAHTNNFGNWCQSDQAQPRCKWVHSSASKHIELQSYLSNLIASQKINTPSYTISPIARTIQITKICDKTLLLMKEDCVSPQIPLSLWLGLRGEAKLNWVWKVWRLKSLLRPLLGSELEKLWGWEILHPGSPCGLELLSLAHTVRDAEHPLMLCTRGLPGWVSSWVSPGEAKPGHCIKAVCSCPAKGCYSYCISWLMSAVFLWTSTRCYPRQVRHGKGFINAVVQWRKL